jgi:hypothetical protein
MARDLTAGMITHLAGEQLRPFLLIEAEFPTVTLRLWSGVGNLEYAGNTYIGAGALLGISEVEENQALAASNFTVTLSGLTEEIVQLCLATDYQERPARFSVGFFDSNGAIVVDPFMFYQGQMDTMTITKGSDSVTVGMSIESELVDGERAIVRKWSPNDQRIEYPDDTGFDYVLALASKDILWKDNKTDIFKFRQLYR